MRDFLIFLVVLAVVFFAVGETRGWYIGIPSQTPVFVYKRTAVGQATRRTINRESLPVRLTGRVRHGTVSVKIEYRKPSSFQTGAGAGPDRMLFDQTYTQGQAVGINQDFEAGTGDYTVVMEFKDATGLFRLRLPTASQL